MYRPVYAYYARQDSAFTIIVVNWKSRASDFSIFLTLSLLLALFATCSLSSIMSNPFVPCVCLIDTHTPMHTVRPYCQKKSYWNGSVSTLKKNTLTHSNLWFCYFLHPIQKGKALFSLTDEENLDEFHFHKRTKQSIWIEFSRAVINRQSFGARLWQFTSIRTHTTDVRTCVRTFQ